MDQDSIDYLKQIQERTLAYDDVRADVLEYVIENRIQNSELTTNLFIMGLLHEANCRNELLTDTDINLFLGIAEDIGNRSVQPVTYKLEQSQTGLDLFELLDLTVRNFSVD
jgi:hypothetical protein